MENYVKYSLFKYIKINNADPISSLFLSDNYVIIGTMFGRVILASLTNKKEITLLESSKENISGISFSRIDNFINISIGDDEIQRFQINENNQNYISSFQKFKIHPTEQEHQLKCENSFIILSSDNLFRLQLQTPEEGKLDLQIIDSEYEIKSISNMSGSNDIIQNGSLMMGNYSIPFDYDGRLFIWIEYLSTFKRRLCCKDFLIKSTNLYYQEIEKEYGHISHIKIISDNQILIAHSLNKCDIRKLDNFFTLIESFTHIGDQIYAINLFYYMDNINTYDGVNNEGGVKMSINDMSQNNRKNKFSKISSISYINQVCECDYSHLPILDDQFQLSKYCIKNNVNNQNNPRNLAVITLDIDGNVNCFKKGEEKNLFNLYKIENIFEINDNIKGQKCLFDMGHEYYIKSNLNFFCITTDYGCLIIKKME